MSSSWPLPPPAETDAADAGSEVGSGPVKAASPSRSVTLSSRSKTALFMPERFWWGAATVLALWIGYLFQVIAVAKDGQTQINWRQNTRQCDWRAAQRGADPRQNLSAQ